MFDVRYLLFSLWDWIIQHGLPLSALLIAAVLVPRVGRQAVRLLSDRLEHGQEETKSKLALVGALVYILEIVAYFVLVLLALTNLGVPAMGAAIPATVVSAAIGFGSQNIIGDFLTGFFIISERHYGVGDVVTFDDTSGQITGTVVKLTLRSTQIRTAAGELVTVPNSKASVTINYSQKWSRAVVDLDVPMTDNESMADLLSLVERASKEAIETAGVSDSIRGDIEVQPALSITPPAAAGLPWSVGMRVNVDTSPATQWAAERAIRANLVNTFWDRYQAPGEAIAARAELGDQLPDDPRVSGKHAEKKDAAGAAAAAPGPGDGQGGSQSDTDRVIAAATAGSDHMSIDDADDDDATEVIDTEGAATLPDPDDPATEVLPSSEAEPATDGRDGHSADKSDLAELVEGPYESKTKNLLSFGGRFRPSTAGLFIALVIVGLLALFSSNPDDAEPGWLSPDRWRDTGAAVETSEETESTEPPADSGNTDVPQNTEVPQDTEDPGETGDTNTGDTGDTGNQGNSGNTGDTGDTTGNTGGSGDGNGSQGNTGGNSTDTGGGSTDTGTGDSTGGTDQNQGQAQRNSNSSGDTGSGETTAP